MESNPLGNLFLCNPIHIPIGRHFEQGWLNNFGHNFFSSGVNKIYHIQFIIGLLSSMRKIDVEENILYRRNNVTEAESDDLLEALKVLQSKLVDSNNFRMFRHKDVELRLVELTLPNMLKDIGSDTQNTEIIRNFFKMHKIGNKEHLKAFLLGFLTTIYDKKSKILLTFNDHDAKGSPKSQEGKQDDILQLNFTTSASDTVDFEIWIASATSAEVEQKCKFVEYGTHNFNYIIQKMIHEFGTESFSILMSKLQIDVEASLTNVENLSEVNSNLAACIAGTISHFGHWRYVNTNAMSFKVRMDHRIYPILFALGAEISCSVLSSGHKDSNHSMAIGYNTESNEMSIIGLLPENNLSTTANLKKVSVCSRMLEKPHANVKSMMKHFHNGAHAISFVAKQDICIGEQLLLDYGDK
uniref:SET domain-containing protein n=1 Tax=Romanomermis culicivorax TaxID=13658 RepID=A0A915IUX6_ROMCU